MSDSTIPIDFDFDRLADMIAARLADAPPTRWLDTSAAAAHLGVSKSTLERWRSQSKGPAYSVLGDSAVRYDVRVLDAWAQSRVVTP
ncbi:MAG: helix-turn-helix domain-containing protein [Planctomycetota bacterium]